MNLMKGHKEGDVVWTYDPFFPKPRIIGPAEVQEIREDDTIMISHLDMGYILDKSEIANNRREATILCKMYFQKKIIEKEMDLQKNYKDMDHFCYREDI